jgi:SAM-dependent methyltransferase
MRKKSVKYPAIKRKVLQVREDSLPGLEVLPRNDEPSGAIARIDKAAAITSHPVSTSALDNAFRRYGVEAEDAFLALASHYLQVRAVELPKKSFFSLERGLATLDIIAHDRQLLSLLDRIVENDSVGRELPVWYQYFLGRRFREGSGKFFTPRPVAAGMAHLLPVRAHSIIMDPTCGGGTFLTEASRMWDGVPCKLVGNDVDRMLVGLTEILLAISARPHHSVDLRCANLFDCGIEFQDYWGAVDCILANPPFSLALEKVGIRSKLLELGYRNSDAVFLDVCQQLLAPGGSLVCLLPHSIIVNSEYQPLRTAVEQEWDLCGLITLPEGVFYLTANTSTRADIVHLRKKGGKAKPPEHLYFANAPSVGIPLNFRANDFGENALEMIVSDARIKECVASCA